MRLKSLTGIQMVHSRAHHCYSELIEATFCAYTYVCIHSRSSFIIHSAGQLSLFSLFTIFYQPASIKLNIVLTLGMLVRSLLCVGPDFYWQSSSSKVPVCWHTAKCVETVFCSLFIIEGMIVHNYFTGYKKFCIVFAGLTQSC